MSASKPFFLRYILIAVACFLTACGGGSSGGSGGGGQGGGSTIPITLSASSVSMQAREYENSESKSITVSWTDAKVAGIAVGYAPGVTPANWLGVSASGNTSPVTIEFAVVDPNLTVGTYTASLRVVAGDANANELGFRTVTVNYTVTERPMIAIDGPSDLTFYAVSGGPVTDSQTVKLSGDQVDWYSSASNAWINIGTYSGVAPADVPVSINPGSLSVGTHTGIAEFIDGLVGERKATANITVEVQEKLTSSAQTLDFSVFEGQEAVPTQTINLSGQSVNWEAAADQTWVELSAATGQANGTLDIGMNTAGLAPGNYSSTLTVSGSDARFGQSIEIAISAKVEARQITASRTGVALASMPSLSNTSAKVTVTDNGGEAIAWAAVSDAAWLSATPSGQTGSDVTLTANPAGLTADMVHYANVTITSSNALISNSEIVKVGFWVGATATNAVDTISAVFDEVITDPVRPYAYVHKNGSQIEVYNVHTAALVDTIASTTIARAGDMAINPEGSQLYIYDQTNFKISTINLEDYSEGNTWDTGQIRRLTHGRVDNRDILFTDNGKIVDLGKGIVESPNTTVFGGFSGNVDVSRNGEVMCGINAGVSPYSLNCYGLEYSYLDGGQLSITFKGRVAHGTGSNGRDVALTHDGGHVYAASGSPYIFIRFNTDTMQSDQELPADAYPNNVEIGSDGLLYGGIQGNYGPKDVWIYNFNGVEQGSYYISGYAETMNPRQLVVSGDALRIIALTEDPKMEFVTVK